MTVDPGPSVLLDVDGTAAIATTHRAPANDPAFFAAHNIDPAATREPCLKAKNHFRAAFSSHCAAIVEVDCLGLAVADLERQRRCFD